jgi:hypothetical protein
MSYPLDEGDFAYEVAEKIWLSFDRSFEFEFQVISFESDFEAMERWTTVVVEFENGRKFEGKLHEWDDGRNGWESVSPGLQIEEIK